MAKKTLLYPDVILRTSIFPAVFGMIVALLSGVSGYNIIPFSTILPLGELYEGLLTLIVVIVGIIVVQGVLEHNTDALKDKGGYSAFRPDTIDKELEKRLKRQIRIGYGIVAVLIVTVVVMHNIWLLMVGLLALMCMKMYVKTHNEWYSMFGFMMSYSVGYFAFTGYLTTSWFIGALIVGLVMKPSQSMYRLDDYLDGDLCMKNNRQIIQYYRNIFRNTLHLVSILIVGLLLYIHSGMGAYLPDLNLYVVWAIYMVGSGLMIAQLYFLKGSKTGNEINFAPLMGAVIGVELYALYVNGVINIPYMISMVIMVAVFARFWLSRHSMCNVVCCKNNKLRDVEIPK